MLDQVAIEYFDLSYSIKDGVPKFKIKLKKEFTEGKGYPKKMTLNNKFISMSSSSVDYFYHFFDKKIAEDLFEFRKKFFNINIFLIFLNIPQDELILIYSYFNSLKIKEKENHALIVKTDLHREKLKAAAVKTKKERSRKLKDKYKDPYEKELLIKKLHSEDSKIKRIQKFKNTMSNQEVKDRFIQKLRSADVSNRKSLSHKVRWLKLSDDEKFKQIENLRYKKTCNLNNINMNLNEYKIGLILDELSISWEYEPAIKIDSNFLYPDFLLNKKIIIECYGTYWHADPRKFNKDHLFFGKYRAEEIWDFDKNRICKLKNLGYDVLIFWEDDIHNKIEIVKQEIRSKYEQLCL